MLSLHLHSIPSKTHNKYLSIVLLLGLLWSQNVHAQDARLLKIGFEFQAYPTGIIPGFTVERKVARNHALHLRFGYQEIRHQDYGVHDDERGSGYGGTLGYRYFPKRQHHGWGLGVRADLWVNNLDWKDNIGLANEAQGRTRVVVLQPTAELSYSLMLNKKWYVAPSAAFGYEINISTRGEDVGEGAIWLLGFSTGWRI